MLQRTIIFSFIAFQVLTGFCWAEAEKSEGSSSKTATSLPASQPDDAKQKDRDKDKETVEGTLDKPSVTKHTIDLPSGAFKYRATAANMLMKDEDGKIKARVFFVSYEKDAEEQKADEKSLPSPRPVTFVFNGGPGAAAVWLHLGTAGPRRINLNEMGESPAPPYRLVENTHSWIDETDLVFIDPVGTGFSRPAEGEKGEQFYGVREDIRWVADFIRVYLTHYQRWLSPLFLAGESYGTTRAAGLSEHLLDRYGIALNGIIFISSVLDFSTLRPGDGNDLPYALFLPTYTAVAWYHKKLPDDLQNDLSKALQEVEQWSSHDYLTGLARGGVIGAEQRAGIIKQLARFTGLSEEFIDKSHLRIGPGVFRKQLLNAERQLAGRFDARITGFDPEPADQRPEYDPSLSRYLAVYSATFNDYVRRELKFESMLPYEVLSDKVHPWNYGRSGDGYLYVADELRSAMVQNPHLKVMFASGYYDLATPYFATQYTIDHLNLGHELQANIMHHHYEGGHMMYHHQPSLAKLKGDVADFLGWALGQEGS